MNINNLECSLLGSWKRCLLLAEFLMELNWLIIQNGSRTNFFGLAAFCLFWFSVHMNSTLLKGDTAPLFLNSWGSWKNSEPSWSHLDGFLDLDGMEESNIWSSGSLNHKCLGSGENHKYHKQETAGITNTQGSEEVESQITKRSFAADGHNHKSQRLMHHASLA